MLSTTLTALSLLPLAFAHFTLEWPKPRGTNEDIEGTFPCGGFDSVSSSRTDFPISGGPVQINLGHTQTNIAVYLALGDDPKDSFNTFLVPQISQQGLGDFCFGAVKIPASLNVTAGTRGTIQVVTNGHSSGGLYQCADVTFVDTPLSTADYNNNCKNQTNSKVVQENISGSPNGTSTDTTASASHAASGSATAAASTAASSRAAAAQATAGSWVLGAIGVAGLAML